MAFSDVALLAPVPFQHLTSGVEVCAREGRVAYGSDNGMLFAELKHQLDGMTCPVLIFASGGPLTGAPKITWTATFLGLVEPKAGRHPFHNGLRPPTTDDDGRWTIFWEVSDLRPLAPVEMILVSNLRGLGKKSKLAKSLVPYGPLLVENPF